MSDFMETQMDDADRAGLDYSLDATCPGCGHAPHAGRCPRYTEPAPGRLVECRCKEKAHGIDQPANRDRAGAAVLGADMEGCVTGMIRAFLDGHAEHMRQYAARGSLAENLEELRGVLDEPLVIYGGKTTREMLEGER